MKKKVNKDISLIDQISEILEPMNGVTFMEGSDGSMDILKNNSKFGAIKENELYFFDNTGSIQQLNKQTLPTPDEVLRMATKAYWKVSGKK